MGGYLWSEQSIEVERRRYSSAASMCKELSIEHPPTGYLRRGWPYEEAAWEEAHGNRETKIHGHGTQRFGNGRLLVKAERKSQGAN